MFWIGLALGLAVLTPLALAASGSFLKGGTRERERDVGDAERARILSFCRERLSNSSYPAARFYPDLESTA